MKAAAWLAALVIGPLLAETSGSPGTPNYSAVSIVNSASGIPESFAPNSFISIYGANLSYVTQAISLDDIRSGNLPTVLLGTGVRVLLNLIPANMYYVSPNQVNILVPASLDPGRVTLQLVNDSHAGPAVELMLQEAAPAIFELDGRVIATHLNGSLVTDASPAARGEIVVLWTAGLGATIPAATPNRVPREAAWVKNFPAFQVLLNGVPVPRENILYAGATPGYGGLFQINLKLPQDTPADPEVRVGYPQIMSPPGKKLTLR